MQFFPIMNEKYRDDLNGETKIASYTLNLGGIQQVDSVQGCVC